MFMIVNNSCIMASYTGFMTCYKSYNVAVFAEGKEILFPAC